MFYKDFSGTFAKSNEIRKFKLLLYLIIRNCLNENQ